MCDVTGNNCILHKALHVLYATLQRCGSPIAMYKNDRGSTFTNNLMYYHVGSLMGLRTADNFNSDLNQTALWVLHNHSQGCVSSEMWFTPLPAWIPHKHRWLPNSDNFLLLDHWLTTQTGPGWLWGQPSYSSIYCLGYEVTETHRPTGHKPFLGTSQFVCAALLATHRHLSCGSIHNGSVLLQHLAFIKLLAADICAHTDAHLPGSSRQHYPLQHPAPPHSTRNTVQHAAPHNSTLHHNTTTPNNLNTPQHSSKNIPQHLTRTKNIPQYPTTHHIDNTTHIKPHWQHYIS